MYLLFLEDDTSIKPLFAYSDVNVVLSEVVSIDLIKKLLLDRLDKSNKITKHYVGSYKFKDADKGEFYALARVINNHIDDILRIDDNKYEIENYIELLMCENKDENRSYKIFKFNGTVNF